VAAFDGGDDDGAPTAGDCSGEVLQHKGAKGGSTMVGEAPVRGGGGEKQRRWRFPVTPAAAPDGGANQQQGDEKGVTRAPCAKKSGAGEEKRGYVPSLNPTGGTMRLRETSVGYNPCMMSSSDCYEAG
jgi:hypothetical protein